MYPVRVGVLCLVLGEREIERGERELITLLYLYFCVYHVSLFVCVPMSHLNDAIGWSAIRHCGISWSTACVCCFYIKLKQ